MSSKELAKKRKTDGSDSDFDSKAEAEATDKGDNKSSFQFNSEGEKCWDLGRKRRATLRKWQSAVWVDIREYYGEDEDDLKPGKKG